MLISPSPWVTISSRSWPGTTTNGATASVWLTLLRLSPKTGSDRPPPGLIPVSGLNSAAPLRDGEGIILWLEVIESVACSHRHVTVSPSHARRIRNDVPDPAASRNVGQPGLRPCLGQAQHQFKVFPTVQAPVVEEGRPRPRRGLRQSVARQPDPTPAGGCLLYTSPSPRD